MGEVGRNQGRWKLLGAEKWLTAHYENPRGSLTCAAALLPLFYSPGSHAPNIDANVTNIEGFNCVISAHFLLHQMYVYVFWLSARFKNNSFFFFFFFLHQDGAAAEMAIWLKLFCQTNDKLMDMKHSSLGQAAEFTAICENILFSHRSVLSLFLNVSDKRRTWNILVIINYFITG